MAKTISIHSFRGGTGKSNITANLSYLLAAKGFRVGVVDTDIQSPGIHMLFGLANPEHKTLNDFLWGQATIENVAYDVSANVGLPAGRLRFIPCSMNMGDITKVLKTGYDVTVLNRGFQQMKSHLNLDYLLIDTHPGLNEETLLSIAISDWLLLVLRPDQQDFQGTGVTVEVARRLKCANILMVVNKTLPCHAPAQIRQKVEQVYQCPVGAVLPLSEKMVELGSSGLAVRTMPNEPWCVALQQVAETLSA